MRPLHRKSYALIAAILFIGGCAPSNTGLIAAQSEATTTTTRPIVNTPRAVEPPATPQSTATAIDYGPEAADFQRGINPLSGLPVTDAALLKIPAVLVSISHFPPEARPQAGLSFAPFVYEFSITGGETRFLATFYGEFPRSEKPLRGPCNVREGAFRKTGTLLGSRVWLDSNRNGVQDLDEGGIPGICVNLRDRTGKLLQTTTTDSNGVYGFNVDAGASYTVEFERPSGTAFTSRDVGPEDYDSDVDPDTGTTVLFSVERDSVDWDAGLLIDAQGANRPSEGDTLPPAEVGPVRSGRLLYAYLAASYSNSCLIYAFADPAILEKLPHCAFVSHETAKGGQMISVERMRKVAEDNMRRTANRAFDYSSNRFSEIPPAGGLPGSHLNVFFGNINQSGWFFDPLYGAYLRMVDNGNLETAGVLHPEVDRLTGRQLHFENVIIILVDTEVVTRTNLDILLEGGNEGPAVLFRDGRQYSIKWSTRGGEYEKRTGLRKPIRFLTPDGSPAALKPGHTWVIIVTPFSALEAQGEGAYLIKYAPAAGEAQ